MEGMEGMEQQASMRFFGSIPFIHTSEVWNVTGVARVPGLRGPDSLDRRRELVLRCLGHIGGPGDLRGPAIWVRRQKAAAARRRYANDPQTRINSQAASAVRRALHGRSLGVWGGKLGYDEHQLVATLKRMVPHGFAWRDVLSGRLHIDHVVAKSRFDVTNPEAFRAAWSLGNLQLLPARENLAKGALRTRLL
jgi:hypothetical protein